MQIDLSRDADLTPFAHGTLRKAYMVDGETSPQQAFARAAKAFSDDEAHAQRLYDYASKKWMMFATPVLSNGGTTRGLPISCFLSYVDDSRDGITKHYSEAAWLASVGGGVGGYWGDIRSDGSGTSNGSKSNGSIPFVKVCDSLMAAFNQGDTRRGAYAAYQDISHPEIEEFLDIRDPNGDHERRCLGTGFHHGVNLSDEFMETCLAGGSWSLIDPKTRKVTKQLDARELFAKIVKMRLKTGEPYIVFPDTANRYLPEPLKRQGLKIRQSNLCTEIFLPTGRDAAGEMRTAVCCLSSVNLDTWDQWGVAGVIELFISDMIRMLDNVLQYFIDHAPGQISWAVHSARMSRDLGLGAMGFHTYLQRHMIAFESEEAKSINNRMFSRISTAATAASRQLATERGEAPDMVGTGLRNAHLMAVAPNASTSIILGVDPSIEPRRTNAFKQSTQAGMALNRNEWLVPVLEKYGRDTPETWKSIIDTAGSVQHLDFLTDHEKMVFKTAFELDQQWIIEHAAIRQPWIDQGQSVNLFFDNDADDNTILKAHLSAWKKGLKSLYYLRSRTSMRANTGSSERQSIDTTPRAPAAPVVDEDSIACTSCEG